VECLSRVGNNNRWMYIDTCVSRYTSLSLSLYIYITTVIGDVLVFDTNASPLEPPSDGRCRPTAQLCCHAAACRAVSWSPHQASIANQNRKIVCNIYIYIYVFMIVRKT